MINYDHIAKAISYYQELKYQRIEVPWFVSEEAMHATAPADRRFCSSFLGYLVASGEQSFIEMMMKGELEDTRYQCVTPCFRDEPVVNSMWMNYFMKVELIHVNPPFDPETSVDFIIEEALSFFGLLLGNRNLKVVDTDIGSDIMCDGIELGSYGYRNHKTKAGQTLRWAYGTGIAEPRFSQVAKGVDHAV